MVSKLPIIWKQTVLPKALRRWPHLLSSSSVLCCASPPTRSQRRRPTRTRSSEMSARTSWRRASSPARCLASFPPRLACSLRFRIVPSPLNKYRDRVCKNIEMTDFYHTILKFPEFGPDIYATEQVLNRQLIWRRIRSIRVLG